MSLDSSCWDIFNGASDIIIGASVCFQSHFIYLFIIFFSLLSLYKLQRGERENKEKKWPRSNTKCLFGFAAQIEVGKKSKKNCLKLFFYVFRSFYCSSVKNNLKNIFFLCISKQKAIVITLSNTSWSFDDDITGIVKKISTIWI